MSFIAMGVVALQWLGFGYTFAFGKGNLMRHTIYELTIKAILVSGILPLEDLMVLVKIQTQIMHQRSLIKFLWYSK